MNLYLEQIPITCLDGCAAVLIVIKKTAVIPPGTSLVPARDSDEAKDRPGVRRSATANDEADKAPTKKVIDTI